MTELLGSDAPALVLVDATSEMMTGEAIVEIHGETTNAEALEAPEANGHPA